MSLIPYAPQYRLVAGVYMMIGGFCGAFFWEAVGMVFIFVAGMLLIVDAIKSSD